MTNISKYFSKNKIIVFSVGITLGLIGGYLIKSYEIHIKQKRIVMTYLLWLL
jgi:hypothetical protein